MAVERKEYENCLLDIKDNYAVITFNRPDKFNAFDPPMFESIQKAYFEAISRENVRALVLTGAGDHFSAGGDVEKRKPEFTGT